MLENAIINVVDEIAQNNIFVTSNLWLKNLNKSKINKNRLIKRVKLNNSVVYVLFCNSPKNRDSSLCEEFWN